MRRIVPDVWTWPWFSERHGYDFNGYLVRHPEGNLCIDPAEMDDATLDDIAREGVSRILLTNRNHTRACGRVRERTGASVRIHEADATHARGQGALIDGGLAPGERIGPFVVLDASGKSPGEVALHWPERKILVVGDACVGNPPGECALLAESVMDDPARLRENLSRLARDVDFETLLPGDGTPILEGGREALSRLVATFG